MPCAVFAWTVENYGTEAAEVSIMFTFKNGQGGAEDASGSVTTGEFKHRGQDRITKGVSIHQEFENMPCTYSIAASEKVR